ncbi:DUF2306 domain-containing protein [Pelagibacterium halotolerans]|uniref:DUF2306 domain-containing protein n=1 Tax=Pelagibacterium halotolerans TaxID=531813 RepID=UPI00384EEF49
MDLSPLAHSALAVQLHAGAALLATILGTVVMLMKKGTSVHKAMGRVWLGLMAVVALSSFGITEIRMFGPYSLLHGLSIFTLFSLAGGFWAARTGNLIAHRSTMISLYVFALLLTGGFTLLPGRRMHAVIFADGGVTAGLVALAVLAGVGMAVVIQRRRGVRLI